MESLFKFIMIRPPEASDPANAIPLGASEKTLALINRALASNESSAVDLRNASGQILASPNALQSSGSDPLVGQATTFAKQITSQTTVPQARAAATAVFGKTPDKVVTDSSYNATVQRLSETLVALKYLGTTDTRTDDLSAAYRALSYIKILSETADDAKVPAPSEYFARTLVIAGVKRPARTPADPIDANEVFTQTPDPRVTSQASATALQKAIIELTGIPSRLLSFATEAATAPPVQKAVRAASAGATEPSVAGRVLTGGGGSAALIAAEVVLQPQVSKDAIQLLSSATRTTLAQYNIGLEKVSVVDAVKLLSLNLKEVSDQLIALESAANPPTRLVKFHKSVLEIGGPGFRHDKFPVKAPALLPTTHGDLTPVGIGDLLVVNQNLKRYEAYDLSDVVNVMKGEHRSNETKRSQSETTTTTLETTTTTEQERDQQTTQRFEMQTEASNVQKTDESLKLGSSISASYGPAVTFKANADFGMNNSKEQSTKVASNYSKEVTDKASSKVTQTVRQLQSTTVVQTYSEDNVHEWNNVAGTDHIVGQYQWLDKIYEAQVFNYGKRLLFDTTVPEPAAFLYYSMVTVPPPGSNLVKPDPFTLLPTDLNEKNYGYYVQKYDAAGVQAPPSPHAFVAKTFDGADDRKDRGAVTKTAEIPLPEGYRAISATVGVLWNWWDQANAFVAVFLGAHMREWQPDVGSLLWSTALNDETGSVGFGLDTFLAATFTCSVEIQCARTDTALESWKLATHEAIKQAYDKQLRDYNDAVAAAQNDAAAQAHGTNPDSNAQLIRDEMKRLMITLFTAQQFDIFGSIQTGPFGYPQMNIPVAEAQGAYIRFFEEAFEWEEMMYIFYPYYWARKSLWSKRVLFTDDDPQFQAFLKAGAARVVVSVRPGFEKAVAHFMETGQIWNGGDPPTITDPTYLSIIDEIKSQENAPQGQVPQGDPWDVRVPTKLIKLRKADSLPEWKKDASGTWVATN